jgi:hypothetical protein
MDEVLNDLATLTGLSKKDFQILQETASETQTWGAEIADAFYEVLFSYEPTARVFAGREHLLKKHKEALVNWYMEVTSGTTTSKEFWQRQWLVGLLHIPHKVTNPYMFGMMSRVQQLFLHKCLSNFEQEKAEAVYTAFKRVTDVTAGLIAESYFVSYITAMENIGGMSRSLGERMMDLEIQNMITAAKKQNKRG